MDNELVLIRMEEALKKRKDKLVDDVTRVGLSGELMSVAIREGYIKINVELGDFVDGFDSDMSVSNCWSGDWCHADLYDSIKLSDKEAYSAMRNEQVSSGRWFFNLKSDEEYQLAQEGLWERIEIPFKAEQKKKSLFSRIFQRSK